MDSIPTMHRPLPRLLSLRLILALTLPSLLCQCASTEGDGEAGGGHMSRKAKSFWRGDEVSGTPKMVIDLSAQRLRYYKGGQLVGETPVSSGREGYSTVNGNFRVIEKDIDHRSSLYGDYVAPDGSVVVSEVDTREDPRPPGTRYRGASMRYFMRITGGIGMHEGYLPGYPASHGCIRLPSDMARIIYEATPHGTPVTVVGSGYHAPTEAPIRVGQSSLHPSDDPEPEKVAKVKATKEGGGWLKKTKGPPPGTTLYLY